MKKILLLLSFFVFTVSIQAQQRGSVSGRILFDGKPAADVVVVLSSDDDPGFRRTARTDQQGRFKFENMAPAVYTIRGEGTETPVQVQMSSLSKRGIRIVGSEEQIADFELRSETLSIREQVLVAADSLQPLDEVSKTVNVIDGQEMRDRADFTLIDSLRTIPGFRVQQLGGFGRAASIKSRGLRNQDTAILIDGVRFRDASAITGDVGSFLADFTLTSVAKIEVLRGPGSSLYGTNAVGGTVDFQTPKPAAGWHGQVGGAFGGLGLGRFRGNTSYGTDDGKFGINFGVSRTAYTKGIDDEDNANNTNFQTRVEYKPFSRTNISFRLFASGASVRLNSNPDTFGTLPPTNATIIDADPGVNFLFDANDPDNIQKSRFLNGQIVVTQAINDELVFQGYYSGLTTRRRNDSGSTSIFDGSIHTANGHFEWSPNEINRVTAGYEFELENFRNEGFTPTGSGDFFTDADQSSHTIYAQDLLQFFNRKLQITAGFRAQFFDVSIPTFSSENAPYQDITLDNPPSAITFDGSASYYFESTGTKLRAHVGNGYRVASLYERLGSYYSTFGPVGFFPLGDPGLKPEKSVAFDAGIEQYVFDKRARLSVTYFYTKLTDTIWFDNDATTFGRFGGYANTKGGIARGAEFEADIRATKDTDIFTSYTYTNSDQRVPQVGGSGIIRTLGIPTNLFTLSATQRFKRFWVNADVTAESSYLAPIFSNSVFSTYIYRFDGNRKMDLTAGYTFPFDKDRLTLRIYGTIENVFDREYFENGFRTAGRTARLGASFAF